MTDEEISRLFFERSEQAITELSKEHGRAAARVARTVGPSQLVKPALYGRDAHWGRIVAAVDRSGADFNHDDEEDE